MTAPIFFLENKFRSPNAPTLYALVSISLYLVVFANGSVFLNLALFGRLCQHVTESHILFNEVDIIFLIHVLSNFLRFVFECFSKIWL